MPELTACPSCGRHSRSAESCCSHCGNCTKTGRTAAAALVGLALAAGGCASEEKLDVQPAYGVVSTDTSDTGDTAAD